MREFESQGQDYVAGLTDGERLALADVVSMCIHLLAQRAQEVSHALEPVSEHPELAVFPPMAHSDLPDPQDPALLRLFPHAVPEESELSREFRRLSEPELRKSKGHALLTLAEVILAAPVPEPAPQDEPEPHLQVRVAHTQAQEVARALTDVRLVLASRLGIESSDDSEQIYQRLTRIDPEQNRPVGSRQEFWEVVYVIAGALQESLMDQMLASLGPGPR